MRYGFDIGGTKMELAAYDDQLNQVWCQRVSTPARIMRRFWRPLSNWCSARMVRAGWCSAPSSALAPGLVIDRRLQRGRNGMAGEWGHLPIPASLVQRYVLPLFPCGCDLTGCYERYVSAPDCWR